MIANLRAKLSQDPLWRALNLLDVSWNRVVTAVLLGVGALGSALALAAVSAWLIARASQMPPVLTLSVAVVGVRTFGISRGVFRYLERLASHEVALRGMAAFRENIYVLLSRGSTAAVAPLRRGDLLARVGHDVDDVGDFVVRSLIPSAVAAALGVGSVILVGAFLPSAAVVLAVCMLVTGILVPWLTARTSRATEIASAAARSRMSELSLGLLEDGPQLVVAGRLDEQMALLKETDAELTRTADDGARPLALAAGLEPIAIGVAVLGALLLGIPAVTSGTLAPVELAVIVLTPLAAFEAASALPAAASQMLRSHSAAARIMALLDEARPDLEQSADLTRAPVPAPGPSPAGTGVTPASSASSCASETSEHLLARDLTCGWPGYDPVLTGLTVTLEPGRVIALVGPSGVGKTTVLLSLAGMIPAVDGTLELPSTTTTSTDAAASGTGASKGSVVLTTEDSHVFHTSVLENLRVARGDLSVADALEALETVGLTSWLGALPKGLDTMLGPDGATISGGERRRLLLARAIASRAQFLLIDEPAEHLDTVSADQFLAGVLPALAAQGRGIMVASHRLSGLTGADEVLVLGREPGASAATVTTRGTHAFLIEHDVAYRGAWLGEQQDVVGTPAE